MKSFEVEWNTAASDMLTQLFLNASDPNSIWPAQNRIDRHLEQRPHTAGIELSEGLWQISEYPLKVFYEIDDVKRLVTVTHVKVI